MPYPSISPSPPIASAAALPWDVEVEDPVAALGRARSELGDTFVVDSGTDRYLFTFSPVGVASFYALPEEAASKGMADWRMLRRKLPAEVFAGRRTLPHELFGRDDVRSYVANLGESLDVELDELGPAGTFDVFAFTRRLGHRMGLASWGGPGCARGPRFDRLVAAFDALDASESFVHPDKMAAVAAADFAVERAALAAVVAELSSALAEFDGGNQATELFGRVVERWSGSADRAEGVALDVVLVHVASMSNLFAALGWALVDLLMDPSSLTRVRAGDRGFAERCALESTRLAQRSIMARYVLTSLSFDVGDAVYSVDPGVTIATLLPLLNTSIAPGLERWDPDRWNRRRLADTSELAAPELVTAFGHGRHTCPAQPFSLTAMTEALVRLAVAFDLTPLWSDPPGPVRAQIGGVARAATPCLVRYRPVG